MATDQGLSPGEVVLVEIPSSGGHEQHGLRPIALITGVTMGLITAIPLTTNEEAISFPHTLTIKPSKDNGLSFVSTALVYQVRALDCRKCQEKLGKLSKNDFLKIQHELKKYLNL
ncbi:MAG: type II toxin-antitoxin system PemK/MazF family toxin [Patescibacteria group bacterium]